MPNQITPSQRHLVFLVHGIRTIMTWRRDLRRALGEIPNVEVHVFYYGFFSLFRFYLPFTRNRIVRKFALEYFEQFATRKPARVSVIAHSFGTYVVCRALQTYPLDLETLILCGSVVPERERFTAWFISGKERVHRVVNDIAQRDIWVLFGKLVIPGVGAGGLLGLSIPGTTLVERVFEGYHHTSFFNAKHYRDQWMPFLRGEEPVTAVEELEIPALYRMLIGSARPVKLLANLILIALVALLATWTWARASDHYVAWTASPFVFERPSRSTVRPPRCPDPGTGVTSVAKFSVAAPSGDSDERFQIQVAIGLRERSRWTIQDVELVGSGQIRMDTPNQNYWVWDVRPRQRVSFLICGMTYTGSGGAFLDDLRIHFSDATRL